MTIRLEAIGTDWTIEVVGVEGDVDVGVDVGDLESRIRERIEQFDAVYSRFRADSVVSKMGRQAGRYELPDAGPMLALYRQLYELTDGRMTPLIGQSLVDAGYDAEYSLRPKGAVATPPAWEAALEWQEPWLVAQRPVVLDVGAAGKGYLVDLVAEVIERAGVDSYMIDAGGDMLHRSAAGQWLVVGLEQPNDTSQVIGTIGLGNASLCGSAVNRRRWRGWHHIVDPNRGRPVEGVQATWVMAEQALVADGLSTALFFVPPERLLERFDFDYLVMADDGSVRFSPAFGKGLFGSEGV